MVIIDFIIYLFIDYNLIFFVPNMQKYTILISALSFSHEVFAILNSSKQNSKSRVEMIKSLY